jgi:ribosome-interacting GTPase 1
MPANLTPQYLEAEKRYKQAASSEEKISLLEEMLALIPKHKGTEKLQADLKSRLSKLRVELQRPRGPGSKREAVGVVEREGAGQIVLLGGPNCGKSSLLASLTNATPEIADYPYTTHSPLSGMMPYENIQIQLVDLPPISPEYWEPRFSGIVRHADAALLLADLSSPEMLEQVEAALALLEKSKIRLLGEPITGPSTEGTIGRKTILVGTKSDHELNRQFFNILQEFYVARFPMIFVSSVTGENLPEFKGRLFELLTIIRIYSKPPAKKVDYNAPFVLKKGSTVLDAAAEVHKDFVEKLKFARIWGSEKFQGQMVQKDHILEEGDVVEFHL